MSDLARPIGPGSCPLGEAATASSSQATAIPRAAQRPSPQIVIFNYRLAYHRANGWWPNFRLRYEAGWVLFCTPDTGWIFRRKRLGQLTEMTDRLNARTGNTENAA